MLDARHSKWKVLWFCTYELRCFETFIWVWFVTKSGPLIWIYEILVYNVLQYLLLKLTSFDWISSTWCLSANRRLVWESEVFIHFGEPGFALHSFRMGRSCWSQMHYLNNYIMGEYSGKQSLYLCCGYFCSLMGCIGIYFWLMLFFFEATNAPYLIYEM